MEISIKLPPDAMRTASAIRIATAFVIKRKGRAKNSPLTFYCQVEITIHHLYQTYCRYFFFTSGIITGIRTMVVSTKTQTAPPIRATQSYSLTEVATIKSAAASKAVPR